MNSPSLSCKEIAELTSSEVIGDTTRLISDVADLESAEEGDISFFANPRYLRAFQSSKADAVFCTKEAVAAPLHHPKTLFIVENPSLAFQKMVDHFHPNAQKITGFRGIHPTAVIHASVILEEGVEVGPYSVIDEGVVIGANSRLLSHVTIGPNCIIGKECLFYPQVVIRERTIIYDRVIIQPGAVIGSCGFGYITDKEGRHQKLNQVGPVILESDVEVGANSTIDRPRFKETRIGRGTKIDNLVQIGHGVRIGENSILVALSGVAGSTKIGRGCILAAQSGVAGHLTLDDGVTIAAKAGVTKSLKKGVYNGAPAVPAEEYNRTQVLIRKLPELFAAIKK